jgi:hypothetical protein
MPLRAKYAQNSFAQTLINSVNASLKKVDTEVSDIIANAKVQGIKKPVTSLLDLGQQVNFITFSQRSHFFRH